MSMKITLSCYFSAFLLALISVTAASSVTYSVVGLPNSENTEFGVLIDENSIHRLSPSKEDPTLLFQVDAPIAEGKYRFVELSKGSDDIVEQEEFDRDPINSQINQVYGRSWTTKSVETFERVYDEVGFRKKTDLHLADEIPALHIEADQDEIDRIHDHYNQKKISVKADATFIGAHGVQKFSNVKFHIAGRASRFEAKLSYDIELAKDDRLGGYKSFKLKASAHDPTFLRDKMAFDMMIAAGLPGTRLSYKRVYLNNVAIGLYVFSEIYDETWFDNNANPGKSDYKNGVFYKGTGSNNYPGEFTDLKYISDEPENYGKHGYEIALEDKTQKKGYTVLAEFTKFVDEQLKKPASNNTENEKAVVAEWGKYVDVEIFLRTMAFEFLTTAYDNYLSWGDNYYVYKCPILHYFIWVGWDMELTFGNSPLPESIQLEGDYRHVEGINNRPLSKAVFRIPFFRNYFEKALEKIVNTIYDPRISFPVINSLAEQLREDVEWDQSLPRINADKDFGNPPEADRNGGKLVSEYPKTFPKNTDKNLLNELKEISHETIDYLDSVEGPTGHKALIGLKEFIQQKYDNVIDHF